MLEANNLLIGYPRRDVVDIPNISINSGLVTALLGPNAAGKSTLIRCLAGALKPKRGDVLLDGENLHRMSARTLAQKLAFVGQENSELFAFTVRELVMLGAEVNSNAKKSASDRAEAAMASMDLNDLAERNLLQLSGGERQRAAIARALAQQTPYIFLDEPTAHLDLRHQAALMNALQDEARTRNVAILIVLHDLNLAAAFADRLILLADGKIAADGPPTHVIDCEIIQSVYRTTDVSVIGTWTHITPAPGKNVRISPQAPTDTPDHSAYRNNAQ
jgi:iron complex transport system ATP-binding protein